MAMFITFEGPEGSGKSTQARLLKEFFDQRDQPVRLTCEPGGSPLGERIRELLLDPGYRDMDPRAELLLYEADRAQHVAETIRPALENGVHVISDRYADSTTVYQGVARDLDLEWVRRLNRWSTDDLQPDLTFVLDVGLDQGLAVSREQATREGGDRLERESDEFHRRVREGYLELARSHPDRCVLLPRDGGVDRLQQSIRKEVQSRMNQP